MGLRGPACFSEPWGRLDIPGRLCNVKGQRLSLELWESEEKGVHPRAEEKQTRCCQENVCKHAGTVERLSMWAVQGTSEALSRFCVRSGSCGLWKREGLCVLS